MKGLYLFGVLLFSFLTSCTENSESGTQTAAPSQEIKPPIYTAFENLEPLFNQQNDTTYVINFWATWCKPCVKELPYFEEIHNTYKEEKVKVVLVSLDFPDQIEKKLIPFLKAKQLKSDVLVLTDGDMNSWIPKVSEEWSGAIPATVVYKNTSREFHEQSFETFEELDTIIKPYIKL